MRTGPAGREPRFRPLAAIVVLLGAAAASAGPADSTHFERIGSPGGPPPAVITALHQDRNGYVWIGSRGGLILFDGSTYTTFRHDPSDPKSLTDNTVRTIYEDRDDTLWFGTNTGGVNRYDPATHSFEHFRSDSADPRSLSHDSVYAILRDRRGRLWVATQRGLNRMDPGSRSFVRILAGGAEGLTNNYVVALCEDRAGRIWAGTLGGGLHLWDDERGRFRIFRHDPSVPQSIGNDNVFALLEDENGRLWIGTFNGLSRMEPARGTFVNFPPEPGQPGGLQDSLVTSLAYGVPGALWVGTYRGGLAELDIETGRFRVFRHEPGRQDSLSADSIMTLLSDHDGSLWIGTWGGGLNRLSRASRQFVPWDSADVPPLGETGRGVTAILQDRMKRIWIGTRAGYLVRSDPATGRYETVLRGGREGGAGIIGDLMEDRSGQLWVGTSLGVQRIDPSTLAARSFKHDPADPRSLGPGYVTALLLDTAGRRWVGTGEGGLQRIDDDGTIRERYLNDPKNPASLSDDYVTVLLEDRRGRIWVGTRSGGLNEFDPSTGRARRFLPVAGDTASLGHHHVTSLLEDSRGRLWVGTAGGGLNRIERSEDDPIRIERITEQEGLVDDDVTGLVEDDDGSLWVTTRRGLSRFDPQGRVFMNLFVSDGLPSAEFEPHAAARSRDALFFGTVRGLVVLRAGTPFEAPRPSPVVVRAIKTASGDIIGGHAARAPDIVEIPYGAWLSIESAVLDYVPEREHRFAYRLANEWIDIGGRSEITFSALQPGTHALRIRGRNSHGVWNETMAPLRVTVVPPFWMTVPFRLGIVATLAGLVLVAHWRRTSVLERRNRELEELHRQRERARQDLDEAYQRLRRLAIRLEAAKEDERQRIARELHDEMGPSLTAVIIGLQLVSAQRDPEKLSRRIQDAIDLVDRMIQRIREISLDLRPPFIDELGLVPALSGYLEGVSERTGLAIRVQSDPNVEPLPPHVPITAFRVVQEAVTNAVRHAGAGHVEVAVRRDGSQLDLSVEDDGKGFDVRETLERAASGRGLGLLGMKERVSMLYGRIEIDSAPGRGTRIHVRLPLEETA